MEKIDSAHLYSKDFEIKVQTLKKAKKVLVLGPIETFLNQEFLNSYDYFILIDGALETEIGKWIINHLKSKLYLVLGDNDSSQDAHKIAFDILFATDKDFSDLDYLIHLPLTSVEELTLQGFLGGRIDHQLGVFGTSLKILEHFGLKKISFDNVHFIFNSGIQHLFFQGSFSLMSFASQNISIKGKVKYTLNDSTVTIFDAKTLSNEAQGAFIIENELPLMFLKI